MIVTMLDVRARSADSDAPNRLRRPGAPIRATPPSDAKPRRYDSAGRSESGRRSSM